MSQKEIRHLTCIICPVGCPLTVEMENGEVTSVQGNLCKRGEKYALSECLNPVRTLTTTVRVDGGDPLSVRSARPIPKTAIFPAMEIINTTTLALGRPVAVGDVVIPNIANTGVDIIATSSRLYKE